MFSVKLRLFLTAASPSFGPGPPISCGDFHADRKLCLFGEIRPSSGGVHDTNMMKFKLIMGTKMVFTNIMEIKLIMGTGMILNSEMVLNSETKLIIRMELVLDPETKLILNSEMVLNSETKLIIRTEFVLNSETKLIMRTEMVLKSKNNMFSTSSEWIYTKRQNYYQYRYYKCLYAEQIN